MSNLNWAAAVMLGLSTVACADVDGDDDKNTDVADLDPMGDEDGDGHSNGTEDALGSDPLDASDVPYQGGWRKGDCRDDVQPSGNGIGEVAENFAMTDQFGDVVNLNDFCDRVVLVEFSGFT